MYVCSCQGVTEADLKDAIVKGAHTYVDLLKATGACRTCGSCAPIITQVLHRTLAEELNGHPTDS